MRDRNALGLLPRALRFRQRDGQDAISERGARPFVVDFRRQSDVTFEASIRAFAVLPLSVVELGPLLTAQDEHVVFDAQFHVLFLKPRKLGGDAYLLVAFDDLDLRPAKPALAKG